MEFVINEWFCEYFLPSQDDKNLKKNEQFLEWFFETNHKLVVVENSEFHRKIRRYSKILAYNIKYYTLMKKFNALLERDSLRVVKIKNQQLPTSVLSRLNIAGTNFSSDQYLFEAAIFSDSKIIVTTDSKLIEHMGKSKHYNLIHLDAFFKKYIIEIS